MLRKLYDWVFEQARKPYAERTMAAVSFAEASFFPIPPDVMLAPMILSRPERAYRYAAVCSIASLMGALFGYAIGIFLEPLAVRLLEIFGHGMDMAVYQSWFASNGFLVILAKGLTPVPFKLVTVAAGLAHFHLGLFVLAVAITRSGRFFLEAWILKTWGPPMLKVVEQRLALSFGIGVALLIGGFILLKLL
ncbi:YqaA family protein [Brevundimonas sp.]|uniref:YqaA family protein n=1 Tax=Brevundimonas sp. TaxID=1871086 RepID=UPI00289AE926|nr:YqaA family protein [Brevundimonas sp.]